MNIWKNLTGLGDNSQIKAGTKLITWTSLAVCAFCLVGPTFAADPPVQVVENVSATFEGEKTAWHGFDRYDFLIDEQTLAIKPQDDEKDGISHQIHGQRRCVIVVPKVPAPGNPWSWRGCYWDHQPQTEIALLKRGFHIAYITADASLKPDKKWDAWYAFLTGKHGLSKKPAFIGMSRGGEYEYRWATTHPDEV